MGEGATLHCRPVATCGVSAAELSLTDARARLKECGGLLAQRLAVGNAVHSDVSGSWGQNVGVNR